MMMTIAPPSDIVVGVGIGCIAAITAFAMLRARRILRDAKRELREFDEAIAAREKNS